MRVIDTAGNIGATASQIVTVDTTAPLASKTIAIAGISDDTGLSSSDFVTRDTTLTVRGTLGAALAADERAQISLDGGVTDHVNRYRHQLELCRWSHTDRRHGTTRCGWWIWRGTLGRPQRKMWWSTPPARKRRKASPLPASAMTPEPAAAILLPATPRLPCAACWGGARR
ncbi:hypothetical protein FA041_04385 [Escherichia coli]|nr:hypothetical protein [Escherichia coli]